MDSMQINLNGIRKVLSNNVVLTKPNMYPNTIVEKSEDGVVILKGEIKDEKNSSCK